MKIKYSKIITLGKKSKKFRNFGRKSSREQIILLFLFFVLTVAIIYSPTWLYFTFIGKTPTVRKDPSNLSNKQSDKLVVTEDLLPRVHDIQEKVPEFDALMTENNRQVLLDIKRYREEYQQRNKNNKISQVYSYEYDSYKKGNSHKINSPDQKSSNKPISSNKYKNPEDIYGHKLIQDNDPQIRQEDIHRHKLLQDNGPQIKPEDIYGHQISNDKYIQHFLRKKILKNYQNDTKKEFIIKTLSKNSSISKFENNNNNKSSALHKKPINRR